MEPARAHPAVAPTLAPRFRTFLEQPRFVALATIDPDGAPRQAVVWYRLEDDGRILINSRIGRRWPANLGRDGRASLAITGPDGYAWLGLTGRVVETAVGERALADILALADRYHPEGPSAVQVASFHKYPRITFLIEVDAVHDHLED